MLIALLSLAWGGGCNLASLTSQMNALDTDLSERGWAVEEQAKRVEKELLCTKDPIDFQTVFRLHEQLAIAAHIRKDFDAAAEHLVARWLSYPLAGFPSGIPTTSPARGRYAALQEKILADGTVVRLASPAAVDGHLADWYFAELPMIVQEPGKKPRIMAK